MTEHHGGHPNGVLTPLRRNRYFPGKVMDSRHFQLEQDYGVRSRRLVNRLGLGAGILCGLGVRLEDGGRMCVAPGVAVDGEGREIVVTQPIGLDAVNQPTDDCAHPVGDPVTDGLVTLWLCYRECGSEYTRLSNGDCGHRERCVPGLLDERFALRIGAGTPDAPPGLGEDECESIFGCDCPAESDCECDDRRATIAALLAGACAKPDECCVALATITIEGEVAIAVHDEYRTYLYSNEELFELLMCLAGRVDECCRPVAAPPRVVDVWPPLSGPVEPGTLKAFLGEQRLELTFERDMREHGLEQPDEWLGVWRLTEEGAHRLRLARTGGPFGHISPTGAQEGAAYCVGLGDEGEEHDVYVVMARSSAGGPIVAATDGEALDGELAATGLTDEERAALWALAPDEGTGFAVLDHVFLDSPPGLPSGDGVQGGELHGAFGLARSETQVPPQLVAVWPPGGVRMSSEDPDTKEWLGRLRERGALELTVSRALTGSALERSEDWVRVYLAGRDGPIYSFNRVQAKVSGTVDDAVYGTADTVTYALSLDPYALESSQEMLVVIRPGAASGDAAPVGEDAPQLLLDADFAGTVLSTQDVLAVWDQAWNGPLDDIGALDTIGVDLHDGAPGGLVHYGFAFNG